MSGGTASNSFASSARSIIDASSTITTSATSGFLASCRKWGESPLAPSKRWMVDASAGSFASIAPGNRSKGRVCAIVSLSRAAALPVGAASAKLSSRSPASAIRSAQVKTMVRVFPVPGAPEMTQSREVAATKAATFCKSDCTGNSFSRFLASSVWLKSRIGLSPRRA